MLAGGILEVLGSQNARPLVLRAEGEAVRVLLMHAHL